MKEAEEDDISWPLHIGDKVEVQCYEHTDHNGEIGTCSAFWDNAPHHFHVVFEKAGGTAERVYHVMYLTRAALLPPQG